MALHIARRAAGFVPHEKMEGWVSPEVRAAVAALARADYDEVVVVPRRRRAVSHVVRFDTAWAPCAGRNVPWRRYPGITVVGELHAPRAKFRAHAIVGQDDSPSSQLQRLRAWRFPVAPYTVVTKPTLSDLVDVLVGWARADTSVRGLYVVAWRRRAERRQFLFDLAVPLHFVSFRVSVVRWSLSEACTYSCRLLGKCYSRRYRGLKACPCTPCDVARHALEPGSVATVTFIDKRAVGVAAARAGPTGTPQLPAGAVVAGDDVVPPRDLVAVTEIRTFLARGLGVALPHQKCVDQYAAGAVTVGDWLALPTAAVRAWDEQWEEFFDRRSRACLDRATLMHASGCFGALGGIKLAMVAHAAPTMSALCPYELCGAPGLSGADVVSVLAGWARYAAFLDRHKLHAVEHQFQVSAIEEAPPRAVQAPRPPKPRRHTFSLPTSGRVKWYCTPCAKPPCSPGLNASV